MDWLGDQPAGAQLGRLPQRGNGDGAGGGQRERSVERHLQGNAGRALPLMFGRAMRLLLNAPSTNLNAQVVVRSVKVTYSASYPDLVRVRRLLCQRLGRRSGHQDKRNGSC